MWTLILVLVLAVAMMLGPIMLMQPSKRQRRLAQLRETAVKRGLKVRMKRMPEGAVRAGEEVTVYDLPWPGRKPLKSTWFLVRQPFSHGAHFLGEWDWTDQREAPPHWQLELRERLPALPSSVLGVEATAHTLGVCWLETTGSDGAEKAVDDLKYWLDRLLAAVGAPVENG